MKEFMSSERLQSWRKFHLIGVRGASSSILWSDDSRFVQPLFFSRKAVRDAVFKITL